MQTADQETVVRMQENEGPRRVEWSGWGLIFCRGSHVIAKLHFPVAAGASEASREACRAWVARGELPDGAVSQ